MKLSKYCDCLYAIAREAVQEIYKYVHKHGDLIDLQDEDIDKVYAIIYEIDGDTHELQIKGLAIHEGVLYAIIDVDDVLYEPSDLETPDYRTWYKLDGSSELYLLPTVANICDNIELYEQV